MATAATISARLILDQKDFKAGLTDAEKRAKGFSSKMKSIGGQMAKVGGMMTAGLTAPIIGAGVAVTKFAVDLQESQNAANVVFGDSIDILDDYGKTVATTAGLSRAEFNQLSAVTGAFLKNVGFDTAQAAEETISLTERASDMASIFNTDVSQALNAIQSGLKGEFNPLEQFGVKLNAAAIEARALEMGLADAEGKISDSAKATAALALVMEQTEQFAGDFVNTSDGLANSMKIAKAQFTDAAAALGTQLLPIGLKIVEFVSNLVEKFNALTPAQQKTILIIAGIVAAIGPLIAIIGGLVSAFGAVSAFIAGPVGIALGGVILPIIAIVAAIAFLAAAWKNNWGDIQGKTKAAVAAIVGLWNNKLLPAFKKAWVWIKTNILPLLESIAKLFGAIIFKAVEALVGLWQNVLFPALSELWGWINDKIVPILSTLWGWLKNKIAPAFDGISGAIRTAIGWISNLADGIMNIQLPDFLTPGSPTPFELGLRGINRELQSMSGASLPQLAGGLGLVGAGAGGGQSSIVNFLPGSISVGVGADVAEVRKAVKMGVNDALRAKGTR